MKELSDKDFDQIFKNKIKEGYPEYEEGSWLKMEEKLRKRDRFVFFRNASIILLFLSFGIGMYLISGEKLATSGIKTAKKTEKVNETEITKTPDLQSDKRDLVENNSKIVFTSSSKAKKSNSLSSKDNPFKVKQEIISNTEVIVADSIARIAQNQVIAQNPSAIIAQGSPVIPAQEPTNSLVNEPVADEKLNAPQKTNTKKVKFPVALSINVGPDFNSTKTAIGGKGGVAVGIGVSVGLTQRLSLQTGANYGAKNYKAKGYDYTFNNPNTVNIISGINAACKVLEVPLRASYTLIANQKNSIDINAGLSSYFMLKENYRFIYTAASGRKDRFLEKENSNQHYLSVIDLSATYNIKLKNKKFALGIQPYVKIPISGIGEGNVPLKSSGISLKLNYELNKKK